MIIIGIVTRFNSGRIETNFSNANDIGEAKTITTANSERNYCDYAQIKENHFEFHDTETERSWSVYGIGLSKRNYIQETTKSFIERIREMSLPTYNKNDRRKSFELLPKGAYVIRILGAKEEPKKNGKTGTNLVIAFDIAEGEYANFYNKQFEGNSDENKKWPNDGTYYLNVPGDDSPAYVWTNWNSFFADLEDSNNGFVFSGDVKSLKGKLIGGKFANDQSSYNGNVYDHTRLKWTCVADDVRSGKPGKMPKDKLIASSHPTVKQTPEGFMDIPEGAEDELPF